MAFLTEPPPERGIATDVADGVKRIVAGNAASLTYHGTNTYLLDRPDGYIVIDPGPHDDAQIEALISATGGRVASILITHFHHDHVGNAAALKAATGATTYSYGPAPVVDFVPDVEVRDGQNILGLEVVHTPGHSPDHLCFALGDLLFTGDHVMGWASTIVSPPHGSMADFISSLMLLQARNETVYLPGHGPIVPNAKPYVADLLQYRLAREEAILALVRKGLSSDSDIARTFIKNHDPKIVDAVKRNVISHLEKLASDGLILRQGAGWAPHL